MTSKITEYIKDLERVLLLGFGSVPTKTLIERKAAAEKALEFYGPNSRHWHNDAPEGIRYE